MAIRVMSSNVWGNTPGGHIVADRCSNLAVVFKRYKPTVLGCQEFSPLMRDSAHDLSKLIEDTYTEVIEKPENHCQNNYTPIFYDRNKVTLGDHGYLYYSGLNDIGSKSASWAVFTLKNCGLSFLFINTHYYWTNDEPGREARINNTKELTALFDKINQRHLPTFVTGDFNCCPEEPPIIGLEEHGFKQARFTAEEPVAPMRSCNDYPALNQDDPDKPFWKYLSEPSDMINESIDHIFVHGNITVKRFITVTDKESLNASDHCPIYIDAEIKR